MSWKGPIRANAAWVVSAVALASCAPSGKVAGPDVRLPEAFEPSVPASQHSELTSDGRWWDAFRDDQLSALIEEAQKRAPDARTALARLPVVVVGEEAAARGEVTRRERLQRVLHGVRQRRYSHAKRVRAP